MELLYLSAKLIIETRPTRRRVATGGIGGIAGWLGGDAGETTGASTDGATTRSSFFIFGDLAAQVAGDAATTELLVPVDQHGHGWDRGFGRTFAERTCSPTGYRGSRRGWTPPHAT